ncbi:hypothetical protein [Rubrivirga marina]|uniref:Uncharacterized protein n=1 Tax=Rubrivirga marina TaxID=1196024 RepID=A0A271IUZ1_9BACT|nr:hypothetical protein [Rubrivirga marina]PAP75071.1 hypothetical protein BSZ37_00700 [Rubrivirga marina]
MVDSQDYSRERRVEAVAQALQPGPESHPVPIPGSLVRSYLSALGRPTPEGQDVSSEDAQSLLDGATALVAEFVRTSGYRALVDAESRCRTRRDSLASQYEEAVRYEEGYKSLARLIRVTRDHEGKLVLIHRNLVEEESDPHVEVLSWDIYDGPAQHDLFGLSSVVLGVWKDADDPWIHSPGNTSAGAVLFTEWLRFRVATNLRALPEDWDDVDPLRAIDRVVAQAENRRKPLALEVGAAEFEWTVLNQALDRPLLFGRPVKATAVVDLDAVTRVHRRTLLRSDHLFFRAAVAALVWGGRASSLSNAYDLLVTEVLGGPPRFDEEWTEATSPVPYSSAKSLENWFSKKRVQMERLREQGVRVFEDEDLSTERERQALRDWAGLLYLSVVPRPT